jgi:hypothetical protein
MSGTIPVFHQTDGERSKNIYVPTIRSTIRSNAGVWAMALCLPLAWADDVITSPGSITQPSVTGTGLVKMTFKLGNYTDKPITGAACGIADTNGITSVIRADTIAAGVTVELSDTWFLHATDTRPIPWCKTAKGESVALDTVFEYTPQVRPNFQLVAARMLRDGVQPHQFGKDLHVHSVGRSRREESNRNPDCR